MIFLVISEVLNIHISDVMLSIIGTAPAMNDHLALRCPCVMAWHFLSRRTPVASQENWICIFAR